MSAVEFAKDSATILIAILLCCQPIILTVLIRRSAALVRIARHPHLCGTVLSDMARDALGWRVSVESANDR